MSTELPRMEGSVGLLEKMMAQAEKSVDLIADLGRRVENLEGHVNGLGEGDEIAGERFSAIENELARLRMQVNGLRSRDSRPATDAAILAAHQDGHDNAVRAIVAAVRDGAAGVWHGEYWADKIETWFAASTEGGSR